MTGTDIAVIIGGLVVGYAFVSALFGKRKPGAGRDDADSGAHGAWSDAAPPAPPASPAPPAPPAPPPAATQPAWWEVLGVAPEAGLAEVKLAYRRRLAEYHPGTTSRLGEELRQLAERKTVAINAAYRDALRALDARGQ